MKLKSLIILILFFSIYFAQNSGPLRLNLETSINLALKNNHDYKSALLDFQKAEEQVRETYGSSLFPSIEGTVNYSRALKRGEFLIETPIFSGRFPIGSSNTLTAGVNVEQPLFTGAMFLAVTIAETFADISKNAAVYSKEDLVAKVKEAYYTKLLADELVKLSKLQLKRADQNKSDTKAMYDAGLVSEYDMIRANVQYQNLIPALSESENQVKLALNNLKLLLGLNSTEEVVINDSLGYKHLELPDPNNGFRQLYEKNKLLQQLKLDTELKDLTKSYEFTQHLPKLNAFGNWQAQAQEEDVRKFSDWRYVNSITVGLSLSVPIFKGFALDSKVEQAEIELKKSQENFDKTKMAVRNEYENAVLQIQKTEEQIEAYEASVKEAERGYQIAVKRYNSGLGTQLEVTDGLVEFSRARINYLQAIHDYYIYHARLDLLLGKSLNEINY